MRGDAGAPAHVLAEEVATPALLVADPHGPIEQCSRSPA
jgi:hypothetical protein